MAQMERISDEHPCNAIDSPCECEHNKPDTIDARLFPSVVLAVAPAVISDEHPCHASEDISVRRIYRGGFRDSEFCVASALGYAHL